MFVVQMAAFNIQEALVWKEKIEYVIDQVIVFGLLLINMIIFHLPCALHISSYLTRDNFCFLAFHELMGTGLIVYIDVCSIKVHKLQMGTNMFLLNINLEWIMGGLLPHQTMKVSKYMNLLEGKATESNLYAPHKFIVGSHTSHYFGYC